MKKAILPVLLVVLLLSGLVAGCGGVVIGSGKLKTQEYDFSDFDRVEVGSAFAAEIVQADSYRVSITADDNLFDHIQVSKDGKTLKIGLKTASFTNITARAQITMPRLRSLDFSGATSGTVSGFSSTEDLGIEVSGASSLELINMSAGNTVFDISGASKAIGDLTAGDVDFDISGASTVQLEGSAKDISAEVSGASHVKLAAFTANNADINLSGASTGSVRLDGRLDADLSGASKLEYAGEPAMGTINTSGASTISKK